MADIEHEKRLAAEAAAALVEDGMRVGLGTGSTVSFLLTALAARGLDLRCVATSEPTEQAARALGLAVEPFEGFDRLDLAIDGADQIAPDGWLVKGGGAAHTREKIVAAAADRFVVIASSDKPVDWIEPPIPLELMEFGLAATLRALGDVTLRDVPRSPDGGVIADYQGPVDDPGALAARLDATPGVVGHGLFPPSARLRDPGRARRPGAAPRPAGLELAQLALLQIEVAVFVERDREVDVRPYLLAAGHDEDRHGTPRSLDRCEIEVGNIDLVRAADVETPTATLAVLNDLKQSCLGMRPTDLNQEVALTHGTRALRAPEPPLKPEAQGGGVFNG